MKEYQLKTTSRRELSGHKKITNAEKQMITRKALKYNNYIRAPKENKKKASNVTKSEHLKIVKRGTKQ